MASEALLKKIAKSRSTKGGNNIRDGKYLFEVKNIICERKEEGETFIVEFNCVTSEPSPGNFEHAGKACWPDKPGAVEVKPNAVGSSPSYVLNLDKNKSAGGNVKAFIIALVGGEDFSEENDAAVADFVSTVDEAIGKPQPCRGMLIAAETFRKKIKGGDNAGQPFVGLNWTHVEQDGDAIAARRAVLDKAAKDAA